MPRFFAETAEYFRGFFGSQEISAVFSPPPRKNIFGRAAGPAITGKCREEEHGERRKGKGMKNGRGRKGKEKKRGEQGRKKRRCGEKGKGAEEKSASHLHSELLSSLPSSPLKIVSIYHPLSGLSDVLQRIEHSAQGCMA